MVLSNKDPSSKTYNLAISLAQSGKWEQLAKLDRSPIRKELEKVLLWLELKHHKSKRNFQAIRNFLTDQKIWPERNHLILRAESLINNSTSPVERDNWFSENQPKTASGKLLWIETLNTLQKKSRRDSLILSTWVQTALTRKNQRRFARNYKGIIGTKEKWDRLDYFLWKGHIKSAQKMYSLVNKDQRRLAEARLRLRHMMGGVDLAIQKVPLHLRNDPGLIYERLRWRNRKGMDLKAQELLIDISKDQKFPKLWWKERSRQIRLSLNDNEYDKAYSLSSSHIQTDRRTKVEADWIAGWIALRFANNAKEAINYFTGMYGKVTTPLSKSRAAYWNGRSFEKTARINSAKKWYRLAAEHQTTYYGQLANRLLTKKQNQAPFNITLNENAPIRPALTSLIETIKDLHSINEKKIARKFLKTSARIKMSRHEAKAIASLALELGYLDMAVYTARRAARNGIILIDHGYPFLSLPVTKTPEPALIFSVIRQESNFNSKAMSIRGAQGYMQLMPRTAKEIAKSIKIKFSLNALIENPSLNIRLGAKYLEQLIVKYKGSYVLAIAAYNAGPSNVKRWIKNNGDPRKIDINIIDWIERIPFHETRNYVQRVLENLHIYRTLLKTPASFTDPRIYWRPLRRNMGS